MQNLKRRFFIMCLGIIILGLGICLFKLSLMGNDPSTAFSLSLAGVTGASLSTVMIMTNCIYFFFEFLLGREYIGLGTFVSWFALGYAVTFFEKLITAFWIVPESFFSRMIIMAVGMLIVSLAVSMYQTANLGISPYDSVALMMKDRLPLAYFWCRIITDGLCTGFCLLLGGIAGLGTLVCAFGLGPFVQFFNVHVSERLCGGN